MRTEIEWYLKDLTFFSEEIGKLREQNKEEKSKLKEKTIELYNIKIFNLKNRIKKRFEQTLNETF